MPRWTWTSDSLGKRADRAICDALETGQGAWEGLGEAEQPPLSRSQVQRLIDEGKVTSSGIPLKSGSQLAEGTIVVLEVPAPRSMELVPENRPLDILFEDEHLIVVNKPPGLTVHPSETQMEGTLVHALLHHVKDLSGIGGVLRPGIVHRIDKDTSGALVVTKTDVAHQRLTQVFSEHTIERRYWALCYSSLASLMLDLSRGRGPSIPSAPGGTQTKLSAVGAGTAVGAQGTELRVESLIGRSPNDRKKMAMGVKDGRNAVTWFKSLEEYGVAGKNSFASWVEARLETGRTHQVRVHLTGIGHSLMGDPVYGVPTDRNSKWLALPKDVQEAVRALPGQALHARVLGFDHPVTGKPLRFEAEPPAEYRRLLEALARYR